ISPRLPPPSPTLFPYTPLFRSLRRDGFFDITGPGGAPYAGNNGDQRHLAGRLSLLWKPTPQLSILSKTDLVYLDFGAYPATPFRSEDTPLNSSHVSISYAVFCL